MTRIDPPIPMISPKGQYYDHFTIQKSSMKK